MGGLVALLVGAIEGWILGVDSSSVREGEVGLNRIQNRNSGDLGIRVSARETL